MSKNLAQEYTCVKVACSFQAHCREFGIGIKYADVEMYYYHIC
jgi:hypothetical protein